VIIPTSDIFLTSDIDGHDSPVSMSYSYQVKKLCYDIKRRNIANKFTQTKVVSDGYIHKWLYYYLRSVYVMTHVIKTGLT